MQFLAIIHVYSWAVIVSLKYLGAGTGSNTIHNSYKIGIDLDVNI